MSNMTAIVAKDLVFSCKTKYTWTYDPAIPSLGIHLLRRNKNINAHKEACIKIFKLALFIMVQNGKYPRDPKIGECVYSYGGILLSNEMNQLLSGNTMTLLFTLSFGVHSVGVYSHFVNTWLICITNSIAPDSSVLWSLW